MSVLLGGRNSRDALRGAGGGRHAAAERGVAAPRRAAAAEEPRARAGREHHHRHAAPPGLRHLPVRGLQRGGSGRTLIHNYIISKPNNDCKNTPLYSRPFYPTEPQTRVRVRLSVKLVHNLHFSLC